MTLAAVLCTLTVCTPAVRARAVVAADAIQAEARDLDPRLLGALALVESSWRTDAVSRRGAQGIMQIMPGTRDRRCAGADLFDARQNVRCAVKILRLARSRCGSVEGMLTAYGGGPCGPSGYAGRVMDLVKGKGGDV